MGRIRGTKLPTVKRLQEKSVKISILSNEICRKFQNVWMPPSTQIQSPSFNIVDPEPGNQDPKQKKPNASSSSANATTTTTTTTSNTTAVAATTSNRQSRKSFVPPRSGLQFKVGPPFALTTSLYPIYIESSHEYVFPYINARLDRGFDFIDNEWIGYKRNYFSLVAAFEFEDKNLDIVNQEKFYYINEFNQKINIDYFSLKLISICCENSIEAPLIEHTAKRDKGPQNPPRVHVAVPGTLPSHNIIKQATNIRNSDKIELINKLFMNCDDSPRKTTSIMTNYPQNNIYKVARYERIQLSCSVKHNRVHSMANRHYIVRVQLLANYNQRSRVLAYTETGPLVIRGRSPSNYKNKTSTPSVSFASQISKNPVSSPPKIVESTGLSSLMNISPLLQKLDSQPTTGCRHTRKVNKPPRILDCENLTIKPTGKFKVVFDIDSNPQRKQKDKLSSIKPSKCEPPHKQTSPNIIEDEIDISNQKSTNEDGICNDDQKYINEDEICKYNQRYINEDEICQYNQKSNSKGLYPGCENDFDEFKEPNWYTKEVEALQAYHSKPKKKKSTYKYIIEQQTFDRHKDYESETSSINFEPGQDTRFDLNLQIQKTDLDFIVSDSNFPTFEEFITNIDQFDQLDNLYETTFFLNKKRKKMTGKKSQVGLESNTSFSNSFYISDSTCYS